MTRELMLPVAASTTLVLRSDLPAFSGPITASGAGSITLGSAAPATADLLVGLNVFIKVSPLVSGVIAAGQIRPITAYTVGRLASVVPNWTVTPPTSATVEVEPTLPSAFNSLTVTTVNLAFTASGSSFHYSQTPGALMTNFRKAFVPSGGSVTFENWRGNRLDYLELRNTNSVTAEWFSVSWD